MPKECSFGEGGREGDRGSAHGAWDQAAFVRISFHCALCSTSGSPLLQFPWGCLTWTG